MNERIDARIVPAALRERAQWVTWRYEQRDGKETKPTKAPLCVASDRRASSTDSRTWSTFDDALAASNNSDVDGIGFVFSADDPFVGVDLDDAISENGALEPWAERIVTTLNSYTERSPSGRGLHIIVTGALPPGGRRRGSVEMYECARYFTITAAHIDGTPSSIEERTDALAAVHAEFVARKRAQTTFVSSGLTREDSEVLSLLFGERAGAKWRATYQGQWDGFYSSQSEADVALARKLRFYTSGDKEQTRRMLLASGLRREKWDERRVSSTYFEAHVIDPAFRPGGKVYVPPEPIPERMSDRRSSIPSFVLERTSAADLRVYAALASFASRERTCYPSVATLASIARISERRVQVALRRLETTQCIRTQRRFNRSNFYELPMRAPDREFEGIHTLSQFDDMQRGDGTVTRLKEQRGDEYDTASNSKGVTFSHQRGVDNCTPKQYQEELLTHGERETRRIRIGREKSDSPEPDILTGLRRRVEADRRKISPGMATNDDPKREDAP